MNEDLIVVDDEDGSTQPVIKHSKASASRVRSSTLPPHPSGDASERATRSSTSKFKPQPKLKLKLSEKAAAQAPGMSFLGQYDRELDSDDDDILFEEHFILRMPAGDDLERLRKMIAVRQLGSDVWFKFKDSRRAAFHIGNSTYSAKLVDLPCVVESQKTLDNKQMFKVADICQMLVVEEKIDNEDIVVKERNFKFEEFIWPHGITPPMRHVRKRRFRKRINKRTIESVEQEVERLLDEDSLASEVKYEILDNVNPDLSDSEFMDRDEFLDAPTPAVSEFGEAPTPGYEHDGDGDDMLEEQEDEEEEEADIDEELAAELELALGDGDVGDGEDEDEDEETEEEEDDDDDDEDIQARKLVNEEIRDLEAAVAKKGREIASSANPLIKKRFEDAMKKLTADLEMKIVQRDEMMEKQRMKKEVMASTIDNGPSIKVNHCRETEVDDDDDDDDLFRSGEPLDVG